MKETRKIILEQQQDDLKRKTTMEQTFEDNCDPSTPKWNNVKTTLKENIAEKGTLFVRSFVAALKPALFISGLILLVVLTKLC